MKVPSGLVSLEACLSPWLINGLSSHCVFTLSFLCVLASLVSLPLLIRALVIWILISFNLSYFFKGSVSKYSCTGG